MASPKIKSVNDLKQYILRKLGGGVLAIELTADQLQDAVDDALDDYLPVAYSGVQERYVPLQLIGGVQQYILPYATFAVLEVNSVNLRGIGTGVASNMFSMNQFVASDLYGKGVAKIDMLGYYSVQSMIETLDIIFASKLTFDFNSISKQLTIFGEIHEGVNDKVVLKVYSKLDLEGTPDPDMEGRFIEENIYDDRWTKRMAVARAQLQWGKNLSKYGGNTLPGGVNINWEFIYNEAKDQIEKLYEELQNNYTLPCDFMVG